VELALRDPLVAAAQPGQVSTRQAAAVERLLRRLEYDFQDRALLDLALTHRSGAIGVLSNERLEFLGDRVLALCIAEWLGERFPRESEGGLGKRLSSLVSRDALAGVADAMGLAAAIRLPPTQRGIGHGAGPKFFADAVEALLGALYLDGGLPAAQAVIRREWAGLMEADLAPPVPVKSRLQELLLGQGHGLPEYTLISAEGPAHAPDFVVRVTARGVSAEGGGGTRRAAENAAALAWLAAAGED